MTQTQQFLIQNITEAIQKAIGFTPTVQVHPDGRLVILANIEGPEAQTPFWQAVLEQFTQSGDAKDTNGVSKEQSDG